MSLDMTKVIDKLKPIEKRQKDADAYFKSREKYENKVRQFDNTIKNKLIEKRAGIDEKLLIQTKSILKSLLDIDPKSFALINEKFSKVTEKSIQTEEDDYQILAAKLQKLESENEKLLKKSQKYKKELGVSSQEVSNLKVYISKLERDAKNSSETIETLRQENENLRATVNNLTVSAKEAVEKITKTEKHIEEYHNLKSLIEESVNIENERNKIDENQKKSMKEKYATHLHGLIYYELMQEVATFLGPKDLFHLKFSSKPLYAFIEEDLTCSKHLFRTIIAEKNVEIAKNKKLDFRLEYEISDSEIEKLINDYVINRKVPGRDLRSSMLKALAFLNKDVKGPLGIKVNTQVIKPGSNNQITSNTPQQGQEGGFLRSFTSYFYKGPNNQGPSGSISQGVEGGNSSKGNITPNYKGNSPGIVSKMTSGKSSFSNYDYHGGDIERFDKSLFSDNQSISEITIDFEYGTVEDIKVILNKFLKSNFPTEKLMNFIKEVVNEYSELLYLSNKTLNEIKELVIVKSAFVERFGKYKRLCASNDQELRDMKKVGSLSKGETVEMSAKQSECFSASQFANGEKGEIDKYSTELEKTKSKYNQLHESFDKMQVEFLSFKTILVKELRNLKFDLSEMQKQRNILRDMFLEFKEFFGKLGINDKGEIMID